MALDSDSIEARTRKDPKVVYFNKEFQLTYKHKINQAESAMWTASRCKVDRTLEDETRE
jgi:hypothetical protein